MLVNIRVGTLIDVDGEPHRVIKAGTPLTRGDGLLKLEIEDQVGEVVDLVIYAPVATDSDLGKIREILGHTEEGD